MWDNFEALKRRLTAVMGGEFDGGDIFVRHVDIWSGTAAIEVSIYFLHSSVPKNLAMKNKDILLFNLDIPDFELNLVKLVEHTKVGRICGISDRHLNIEIGSYRLELTAATIHFGNFRLDRYAELVDMNWT